MGFSLLGSQLWCGISPTRRTTPRLGLLPIEGTRLSLQVGTPTQKCIQSVLGDVPTLGFFCRSTRANDYVTYGIYIGGFLCLNYSLDVLVPSSHGSITLRAVKTSGIISIQFCVYLICMSKFSLYVCVRILTTTSKALVCATRNGPLPEAATQVLLHTSMTLRYRISPTRSPDSAAGIFVSQGPDFVAPLMEFSPLRSTCELNSTTENFPIWRKHLQESQMGFFHSGTTPFPF